MKVLRAWSVVCRTLVFFGMVSRPVWGTDFELAAISQQNMSLHSVQTSPVQSTKIADLPFAGGTDMVILADAGPNAAWTINRTTDELFKIRLNNGSIVTSVQLDADLTIPHRGLDRAPDGTLFGVFDGPELRTIDPTTGITTLVGNIDLGRVEGITFGDDGTLYAIGTFSTSTGSDRLYTLDPTTGLSSFISTLPISDIDTITFAPDGFLYGADSNFGVPADLLKIDPSNGALTNLGSTGVLELTGIMVIPEPGSILLLGGGALAMLRRRRRSAC